MRLSILNSAQLSCLRRNFDPKLIVSQVIRKIIKSVSVNTKEEKYDKKKLCPRLIFSCTLRIIIYMFDEEDY